SPRGAPQLGTDRDSAVKSGRPTTTAILASVAALLTPGLTGPRSWSTASASPGGSEDATPRDGRSDGNPGFDARCLWGRLESRQYGHHRDRQAAGFQRRAGSLHAGDDLWKGHVFGRQRKLHDGRCDESLSTRGAATHHQVRPSLFRRDSKGPD